MAFYSSRGQRLHYETIGTGQPVVMIHGITNYSMVWASQISDLVYSGYSVILPDLAGHGSSQAADSVTTVEDFSADIIHLLNHLKLEKATLCGLSLGGMIAQTIAVSFPERVDHLFIANSLSALDTIEARKAIEGWIELFQQEDGPLKRLSATWPKLVNKSFQDSIVSKSVLASWKRVLTTIPGSSFVNICRGLMNFNIASSLNKIAAQTLIITGSEDHIALATHSQHMANQILNSDFQVIHGASHLSNLDSSYEFNKLLLGFLSR